MSQGRFSPPLGPEDDWFDDPEWFPEPGAPSATAREAPPEPRARPVEPGETSERSPDRRLIAGVAVLAALALLVGGVVAARALTGADGTAETTTALPSVPTTTTITTTPDPTTPTSTETTTQPEDASLRPGDEGERVRQLQEDLVAIGYSTGGIDGKYGPATEEAVRAFQTSSGLVVDGVAGALTLAALAEAQGG